MAKTKKRRKRNTHGIQQHKEMLNQHRKDYFQRLTKIAKASGACEVYKKFSKKELTLLEMAKVSAFKIEEAETNYLGKNDLKELRYYVASLMKTEMLTITEGCPQISLYDYFSAGVTLKHFLRLTIEDKLPRWEEYQDAFRDFIRIVDKEDVPRKLLKEYGKIVSWTISTIHMGYFWFQYELVLKKPMGYDSLKVYVIKPTIKHFNIGGHNRPAFRGGLPINKNEIAWVKIKASELGNKSAFANLELDVYVQSHALVRLKERLDVFIEPELHLFLLYSLNVPKIIINHQNRCLIEYTYDNSKLGYLVAEVVDGVVLIKTFLFLTNDGTPEGEKLQELVGLSAVGKKYFEIDKLSTFIYSDIQKDEKLKSLFVEAGCKDLFNTESIVEQNREVKKAAESILKYLTIK